MKRTVFCYEFTPELDKAIENCCYRKCIPLYILLKKAWLSQASYYAWKKSKRLNIQSAKKLKEAGVRFNWEKLNRAKVV